MWVLSISSGSTRRIVYTEIGARVRCQCCVCPFLALCRTLAQSCVPYSLYWTARMLESGEDPLYVARRLLRMAVEDVGLARPEALNMALATYQATQLIGMPECDVSTLLPACLRQTLTPFLVHIGAMRCVFGGISQVHQGL